VIGGGMRGRRTTSPWYSPLNSSISPSMCIATMETEWESMNEAPAPSFLLEWKSKIPTENSTLLYLMIPWNFSVTQELHLKSMIKGASFSKVRI